MARKTNFYVDGFNFYHGCIRDTPYRCLDLEHFFRLTFPSNPINRIRYFTAILRPTAEDPEKPQRQLTYIRALQTNPLISVHLGRFDQYVKKRPLATSLGTASTEMVKVIEQDEKGSDVNLASYLLMDGFKRDYDTAIVVSNDSDLAEPIRMVRQELGLVVGILNPRKTFARDLQGIASFYRRVREGPLKAAQMPDILTDEHGTITKPDGW